jgi:hypothetical protein
LLLAATVALPAVSSLHAQERIKAGLWQFTAQIEPQPGVQSKIGANFTNCIDPARSVPVDPSVSCRIDGMNRRGTAVTWATTCTTPDGTFQSQGAAQYSTTAMSGTLTTEVPVLGGQVVQLITGRYLGPARNESAQLVAGCQERAASPPCIALMSDGGDDAWEVKPLQPGATGASRPERVARYRQQAAKARQRAAEVTDPTVRQELLEIAAEYDKLAASIEG